MSEKSRIKNSRRSNGIVISLVLTGGIIFVAIALTLVYAHFYSTPDDLILSKLRFIPEWVSEQIDTPSSDPIEEVSGVSEEREVNDDVKSSVATEELEEVVQTLGLKEVSLDLVSEQNDTVIHLTEIEMEEKVLVATFKIQNNSEYTIYFPFYGTNASYDDNGGSMYRDLDSENNVDYDQIPTVINAGEEVIGRIAYTPLIYYDKPFTIYISGVKFREIDVDWTSYEFYFDPSERL